MMNLSVSEWHSRFLQQARWTAQLRNFISNQLQLNSYRRILEVGSGTGVILAETGSKDALRIGVDIRLDFLQLSQYSNRGLTPLGADGFHLPFSDHFFDITFCHFLLLWVHQPLKIIEEMVRVTQPGGIILALAEPDYGGRIDHPIELVNLGLKQAQALEEQGADPFIGRKVKGLFSQAGLFNIQSGIIGGHWAEQPDFDSWDSEWNTLEHDLKDSIIPEELHNLRLLDAAAWQKGERILFVPTFYTWGRVKSAITD